MIWRTLIVDTGRLLSFRQPSAALHVQWRAFLGFGLFCTWLAGIGRYWDNPRAHLWQYLGLGSLIYVLLLALLVWALLYPLRPSRCSYRNVLLFITLTAPPALLYAIPVERFMSMEAARDANVWFLAIVASWRVAMFAVFLRRVGQLLWLEVVIATLLPLTIIVVALAALNLEHVVFNLMGGLRDAERSSNDTAYFVVWLLSLSSVMAAPVLLLFYGGMIYRTHKWGRPASRHGDNTE